MVYRTPCPPPEEPKMKEPRKPFVLKDWHLMVAMYVCVWVVAFAIFVSNRTEPHALAGLIGCMAGLHALACLITIGIRNVN